MHCDFVVHIKHTIFWLSIGFRMNFYFYVPDFSKSMCNYLLGIKVDRKYGFMWFTTMCTCCQKWPFFLFGKSGKYKSHKI